MTKKALLDRQIKPNKWLNLKRVVGVSGRGREEGKGKKRKEK